MISISTGTSLLRLSARSSRASRSAAFTLIELILVMAILTIAISLTAPALASFFRGRSLDSEARRLLALTRQGQSRAVSEGVPVELWFDPDQSKFGLETEPSYEIDDPKAVEFSLATDMALEIPANKRRSAGQTAPTSSGMLSSRNVTSLPLQELSRRKNLQRIRFLPDGTISEVSPDTIRLVGRDGFVMTLTQTRNGMGYEIQKGTETN